MKLTPLVLAIALTIAAGQLARSAEVETKGEFGIWGIKCIKQSPGDPRMDCSLAAGGVAPDDPTHWAKVGVAILGHNADPKMTIRIPGIKFLGDGISVAFDDQQYGRVFIQNCDFGNRICETTFNVDSRLQSTLATKRTMSVEYKFDADKTTYIEFDLKQMLEAMGYLAKLVDPANSAMASSTDAKHQTGTLGMAIDTGKTTTTGATACCETEAKNETLQFVVERRKSPYNYKVASFDRVWETPLQKCPSLPEKKEVVVRVDLRDNKVGDDVTYSVQNEPVLTKWLNQSAQCSQDQEPVFWIRAKLARSKEAPAASPIESSINPMSLASQTLYKSVKATGAIVGIVPNEGVAPTLPLQTGLIASESPLNSFNWSK